jgi:hypothetical protein
MLKKLAASNLPFQLFQGLFKKIPFLYIFLDKSLIKWTLGQVMDIYCRFDYASKECFWPKKISNFGKIEKLSKWHFLTKSILLHHYKMAIRKNIHNLSQGLPNQGFMQEKVQKGDFLKKPL